MTGAPGFNLMSCCWTSAGAALLAQIATWRTEVLLTSREWWNELWHHSGSRTLPDHSGVAGSAHVVADRLPGS